MGLRGTAVSTAAQGLRESLTRPLPAPWWPCGSIAHPAMSIHLLLISREERQSFAFSRLRLVVAPTSELDSALLGWLIDCPVDALEFTRVGPVDLAHGGAWARRHHLDSFRWPHLDQPVIHGRAVGIRMGVRWPGEAAPIQPLPMRALTEWEGRNALRWLRDEGLPLGRLHCPVDEAFLGNLGFPLHQEYLEADQASKLAIRLRVSAQRKQALEAIEAEIEAKVAADRIKHPVGSWLAQREARRQELSRR